jgi:hypothetical protein
VEEEEEEEENKKTKQFCELIIAYFPFVQHGLHRKRKQFSGNRDTQYGDLTSLLTEITGGVHRETAR